MASRPANLRYLRFWCPAIEDTAPAILANWPGLANLEELAFQYAKLNADGVKALAASPHLTRLRKLAFARAGIGDEGRTVDYEHTALGRLQMAG